MPHVENRLGFSVGAAVRGGISVVVPCLDGARHIQGLLDAIDVQDTAPLEVIVVDGGSRDGTQAILERYRTLHPRFPLQVLESRRADIPVVLNAGIREARGEIIVRLDVRTRPRPDYLRRAVNTLREVGQGVVGGRWEVEPGSETSLARAIAWAVQHPLGAGNAAYRVGRTDGAPFSVDTVPYGCFEKRLWNALGGFNERLLTNEDYEFNYRVRSARQPVTLDPLLVSKYVARAELSSLARQYFRYGWWKAAMLKQYPQSIRIRQFLPAAFVAGMASLAAAAGVTQGGAAWFFAAAIAYLFVLTMVSAGIARRNRAPETFYLLPLVFLAIHFAWGTGFWLNTLTAGKWPRWR